MIFILLKNSIYMLSSRFFPTSKEIMENEIAFLIFTVCTTVSPEQLQDGNEVNFIRTV